MQSGGDKGRVGRMLAIRSEQEAMLYPSGSRSIEIRDSVAEHH